MTTKSYFSRLNAWGAAAMVFIAFSTVPVRAQLTSAGSVSGQVTDASGAAIKDAIVSLKDTSTGGTQTVTSNETGRYIFLNVSSGSYDLTVSMEGFKQARLPGQKVLVGSTTTLNVTLEVGSTTTSVDVKASPAAELQTTTASPGTTILGPALMTLPNLGRDANAFVTLQPGVAPGGEVAGKANDQNVFSVDGGNISSDQDGNYRNYTLSSGSTARTSGGDPSGVVPTPVESVEEFRVSTNNQTADFNAGAGGQVQMVTKRGTNNFHVSAYEYFFGSNLSANTWANNRTNQQLAKTHEHRFGAALGGPLTPELGGHKTYFFFNYEGRRFPQVINYQRAVPTKLMRAGVIQVPDASGAWRPYNLNPRPVTVDGTTYMPAMCGTNSCDPRAIGLNPVLNDIWTKYMPLPNNPEAGDRYNTQGYFSQVALPVSSNFAVARIDRDLTSKHRLMLSYRYYHLYQFTTSQVDIGGFFPGNTLGQPKALTDRPQTPSFYVAGLTSVLSPRLINDFRANYTRNSWEWGSAGAPAQLPGLTAAVDSPYLPYEVNRNNSLSRYWNGQDKVVKDDLSLVHRNHLFQFGGAWTRWYLQHQRNDNGLNMTTTPTYLLGTGEGIATPTAYIPSTVPANQYANWNSLYSQVLGFVAETRVFYPRKGGVLQPFGTSIKSDSIVHHYNFYFNDTWKMTPTFTLIYGLGYQVQMPPYEKNGNQPMIVDAANNSFSSADYLAQRERAALGGGTYQPIVGFSTIRNVGGGRKYPFDPIYSVFSPRVAASWNPHFSDGVLGKVFGKNTTVLRGGYARIYGRVNGINIVQVPLQGTGIGQAVACIGASRTGQCAGTNGVDPATAFRIGTDGMTAPLPAVDRVLAQPYFPGIAGNASLGETWVLDTKLVPPRTDQFTFSIQRQMTSKTRFELGYIGMISRNEMWRAELNAVPYMTTLNGQSFSSAFANTFQALYGNGTPQAQPFFEAAMGGPTSPYCTGYANCTVAVATKLRADILNTNVRRVWSGLDSAPGWTLGRTLASSNPVQTLRIPSNMSGAWSNYNAVYLSMSLFDWKGVTATSNLTFSRALGTGGTTQNGITSMDTFRLQTDYRPLGHDVPWVYNLYALYELPYFRSQRGIAGRVLGGWSFAPLFRAQSGFPLCIGTGAETFGSWSGGCAVETTKFNGGNSAHQNLEVTTNAGRDGNPSRGGSGLNMFANPQAVYDGYRPMVLGVDTRWGNMIRGFPRWNVDMAIKKTFLVKEGIGATLSFEFLNFFNHFNPADPGLSVFAPTSFGVVTGQAIEPRRVNLGLRLFF
ncbi:MAG: carboxypeptidase regulatory-like domain-containing protein [Bryobacterales bacterium]|nr:carboxypeptidase regulatory-like domain-containing protein [Bryobacterales bacterium]